MYCQRWREIHVDQLNVFVGLDYIESRNWRIHLQQDAVQIGNYVMRYASWRISPQLAMGTATNEFGNGDSPVCAQRGSKLHSLKKWLDNVALTEADDPGV